MVNIIKGNVCTKVYVVADLQRFKRLIEGVKHAGVVN